MNNTNNVNLSKVTKEIVNLPYARFVSIHNYTSKTSGEVSDVVILLGANLESAYKKDLKTLQTSIKTLKGVEKVACQEMIDSITESLKVGIGKNSNYTCQDVFVNIADGLKLHPAKGQLYVYGYVISKKVIEAGVHKTVNSSDKTIAKNKLNKGLRRGKFRQYILNETSLDAVAINGKTLTFSHKGK